ncbi:hypothetical protein ACFLSX_02065 [Calditrichota bacterium]
MKAFYFLLFPLLVFSQNPSYPDTIFLKSDDVYPCLVDQINSTFVKIVYKDNIKSSAALRLLEKINLGFKGIIYNDAAGFTSQLDSIQNFISQRNKNQQYELNWSEVKSQIPNQENKWSFGAFYIPYYSGKKYYYIENPMYSSEYILYIIENSESSIEGQFAYAITPKTRIIFDFGYNSVYTTTRLETHWQDFYYSQDEGSEQVNDIQTFVFNIGLRHYFAKFIKNKVSAFIQIGIGKQFAFVDNSFKVLYPDEQLTTVIEDNRNEFEEDLNSPFFINLGFGTEYFFNESLSIYSSIRFYYSKVSGSYTFSETYENWSRAEKRKYKYAEIVTRIGIGLNFYFSFPKKYSSVK